MEKKNKLGDEVENGFMDDIGEKKTIKQNISGRFSDAKKLQRRHFSQEVAERNTRVLKILRKTTYNIK